MTAVAEVALAARMLSVSLTRLAATHPDAALTRSEVGNLSIVDTAGAYIGWADTLTGQVHLFERDGGDE